MANDKMITPKLYLASQSPRRHSLLSQAGIRFHVHIPREDEKAAPKKLKKNPGKIVREIAEHKALACFRELTEKGIPNGIILAADTLVFLDDQILGKPQNRSEARKMLKELAGRSHRVFTGVHCFSFVKGKLKKQKSIAVRTKVKFFTLPTEIIDWYISTGEPFDKAGAYGAQELGGVLVKEISCS